MRPQHTIDRKPEIVSPATQISTPTSTFNPNATVLELILKLRSCIQLKDSEEVAAILQSREDKLKQTVLDLKNREDQLNHNNLELKSQVQTLTKKCGSLEMNCERSGVEKERIEAELKRSKAECEAYRDDQVSVKYELERVRLESKMRSEKEDIAFERFEKRIKELEKEKEDVSDVFRVEITKLKEDLEKERGKGKEEIVRLKGEIGGLVDAKRKAEESARYWERNYKQCEPRVLKLESDLLMIFGSDPAMAKVVEKAPSIRNPPAIYPKSAINGNPELVERQKQSNVSKCDENAHASPCAGSTAESPMVNTSGPKEAGPNPSVMGMPRENQVVIEINDSDDEKPIIETASASKTNKEYGRSCDMDPASQLISREKRPVVCTQINGDVDGSSKNKKLKLDSPFPNKADENSYLSDESITSLDMEKLVSKIRKNKPFKYEVEMLTAFNKDDELCLNAVCALHRVEKCDKSSLASPYRGFSAIDATRGSHLAKFLTDRDPLGKLRKSVEELQQYDSKGIAECRKLARNHLKQLYQIYQEEEDPFFKEYVVKNHPKKAIS